MVLEISFCTNGKDIEAIFRKIKKEAEDIGLRIKGSREKGTFSGFATKGSYEFTDKSFSVYIEKKPSYADNLLIKNTLEQYFK